MKTNCVFCDISSGKIPSKRIYENDNFFSILDLSPQVKGHALVISKKHFENILDLPSSISSELLDCVKKTFFILNKDFKAEGFNLVSNNFEVAGQVIKHVHFHILPRKNGDGYSLSLNK